MTQNRSSAVMAQRIEPHDSLDFFPTPPWATRALCEHLISVDNAIVWDPACGDGAMARPLAERAVMIFASDIHDYGRGYTIHDFLMPYTPLSIERAHWIVTNPPFRLAEQFIQRGLAIAERGVAMLVRSVFVESVGRYESLFRSRPPAIVAQFAERVPMVKGRLDGKASTATAYCWLVWMREPSAETRFRWIPPCRKALERAGDYPDV